jgi:hypothetical protein
VVADIGNALVTIGLQTEEAGRLIGKFPPIMTLWQILRFFEKENGYMGSDQDQFNTKDV